MLRGCCFGLALLVASPVMAQPADPLEAKVRSLAHPRYAEREKAARDLEAAGEPALKVLREAARSNDEEVRARAAAVCGRIERTLRSQRLLAAPKLALKFDSTPLEKAVTEFVARSHRPVVLDKVAVKNQDRTVTLNTGEVPYWEAVQAFYRAAGLVEDDEPFAAPPPGSGPGPGQRAVRRLQGPGTTNTIRLIDGEPPSSIACDRALRVRALPAGFAQNKYDDVRGEVTFHLDVDPAPTLAVREVLGVEVRRATAEDGRPLAAAYPGPAAAAPFEFEEQLLMKQLVVANGLVDSGPGGSPQAVTLKTHGLRPKKLAELHGMVVARVVTPPEALVAVPQLLGAEGKEVTVDGLTVQVKDVDVTGKQVVVLARLVTRSDLEDDVLNLPIQMKGRIRQFIRINRGSGLNPGQLPDFKIHDAAGVPLRGLSARVASGSYDGTIMVQDVKLTFDKPLGADPLSLVLMGKRAAVVEMPFVLKDVPLP